MATTLLSIKRSTLDLTQKMVYRIDRSTGPIQVGIAAIDKQDGKDVLCVPCQTNCAQACKFCHTTEMAGKVAVTNLTGFEMADLVEAAWNEAGFSVQPLLVSYMGCGEPMANHGHILRSMLLLQDRAKILGVSIRYGFATMLPANRTESFREFTYQVAELGLKVKAHLSLHFTNDDQRKEWMPNATPIAESINLLESYRELTKNPIEIHYTLIGGMNDSVRDAEALRYLLTGRNIAVKLLKFNPKADEPAQPPNETWERFFASILTDWDIPVERYDSLGKDIQASCGMFAVTNYTPSLIQVRQ
jgi:23S rRNA (adenine2503-C2)-methyltransferase